MNIQDELQKIHHQYGISEKANYEIELLFNKMLLPHSNKSEKWGHLNQHIKDLFVNNSDYLDEYYEEEDDLKDGEAERKLRNLGELTLKIFGYD